VGKVVIGMLDPNVVISGKGVTRLRESNIEIAMFPKPLAAEIEALNRDFIREQKRQGDLPEINPARIQQIRTRSLDECYSSVNKTFWNQNYHRDASAIFTHLVEVVGGLSALASNKRRPGVDPTTHIGKALAWWLTLCGKLGIKSVEKMLWDKFPNVCPYCQRSPHDQDICSQAKAKGTGLPWELLVTLGSKGEPPKRLRDWQRMFSRIYPPSQTGEYGPAFARLTEELGELAEAVRVFRIEPGYVLSEASDVFAWLMQIQNISDTRRNVTPDQRGNALEELVASSYPGGCVECERLVCACPAILPKTIGRIAHEVPPGRSTYGPEGRFMSPEIAGKIFWE
jgi:NTP pyrophosphatase (non-canonical NTP hydrolase)